MGLLLKTPSHTSTRPGYEARKTRRKGIEGNVYPRISQATDQNLPHTAGVAGGGRNGKGTTAKQTTDEGAMARKTIVESLARTVSVVGGATRREAK